jgi:hypothetical protein
MNDTKPSALLVRITHTRNGEASSILTMDNSNDAHAQSNLRDKVRDIGRFMADVYGAQLNDSDAVEILTGRTANQIERQADLLNDCRNLLIDIEARLKGLCGEADDLVQQCKEVLEDLDAELGL